LLTALGAAVFTILSCDSFYSTSWGKPREYRASNIKISADNVDSWIDASTGNPELAAAVSSAIRDKLKNVRQGSPTADQIKIQEAGTKIAIEEAGLGTTILGKAGTLLDKFQNIGEAGNDNNVTSILLEVLDELQKNGVRAAGDISGIVGGSLLDKAPGAHENGDTPQFCNSYIDAVQPSDAGQAILILALAVFDKDILQENNSVDLANPDSGVNLQVIGNKVQVLEGASPEEVTLAAYLNMIAQDPAGGKFESNTITGAIKSAFGLGRQTQDK
jgi:hypothetical protein